MDFLVDVHLPISLSKFLNNQPGCSSIHVNQILQKWHTADAEICRHADRNGQVVITKDEDFKNSYFINKTPRRVIRITLGNTSNAELILFFERYLPFILPLSAKPTFYVEISKEQITIID
jgi:predicted nuclease of predicted toxin-antitoxin system